MKFRVFQAASAAVALLAVFAAPVRAELCTTWEIDARDTPLTAENTNAISLLGLLRAGDDASAVLVWRDAAPGDSAPASRAPVSAMMLGGVSLSGFSLVSAASGSAPRAVSGSGGFEASDSAGDYDFYQSWGPGEQDFSEGFGDWFPGGDGYASRDFAAGMFRASTPGGVGVGGVAREFEGGARLDEGTFGVSAVHGFFEDFSGFALYSDADAGSELLRWGITTVEVDGAPAVALCTAVWNGGSALEYLPLQTFRLDESQSSLAVDYEIAWQVWNGGLEFQLSASSAEWGGVTSDWIQIAGVSAVSGVGVLVAGHDSSDAILFAGIRVSGHAVPEPSSLALLLLGGGVLAARRRVKGRHLPRRNERPSGKTNPLNIEHWQHCHISTFPHDSAFAPLREGGCRREATGGRNVPLALPCACRCKGSCRQPGCARVKGGRK